MGTNSDTKMKERTLIRRIVICLLITLASISFLAINILLPTFAESPSENQLQPKWFEFPLAYGPSAEVDIDKHRIVWSQYAWSDQYPPCDLVNTKRRQDGIRRNAQGAAWFICLFDTRTRTITPVVDLLTFSHWPRLDGDWLVWTAGDSFRDIWAKNLVTGQEIMLPGDLQPDNASIYQNRVVFKDFAYITSVGFAEKVMLFDLSTQQSLTISVSPDH